MRCVFVNHGFKATSPLMMTQQIALSRWRQRTPTFVYGKRFNIKRNRWGLRLFGEFKKSAKKISSINKIDKTLLNHYSLVNTSYLFLMINAYPPGSYLPSCYNDVTKIAVFRRTSFLIPGSPRYFALIPVLQNDSAMICTS